MKRVLWGASVTFALALAGGCMPEPEQPARDAAGNPTGWTRPPEIAGVRRADASLIFVGEAQPGARVVLRNDAGAAYAAVADPDGRFEIRMAVPSGALLLRPETQVGQDAAVSPDRLLIIDGGRGPIAILRLGGPTRRLDPAPWLGAIDSDPQTALASGQTASAGQVVAVGTGRNALQVRSGPDRRWSLLLGPLAAGTPVTISGETFVWPGAGDAGSDLRVERAGQGWRIGWAGPLGARQWTWLPDSRSPA